MFTARLTFLTSRGQGKSSKGIVAQSPVGPHEGMCRGAIVSEKNDPQFTPIALATAGLPDERDT